MSPAVFARGHLRLYLLSLLGESPRHGYELIQALSDRFGGAYVPSAGTVYPRLAKLEDDGLVTKQSDGRKTVYAITEAGREELRRRESELQGIEGQVTDSVRQLAEEVRRSVDDAMRSLRADLAAGSGSRERTAPGGTAQEGENSAPMASAGDGRGATRDRLRETDAALTRFRADVRTDLRRAAATGSVPDDALDALQRSLDETLEDLRSRLRA